LSILDVPFFSLSPFSNFGLISGPSRENFTLLPERPDRAVLSVLVFPDP